MNKIVHFTFVTEITKTQNKNVEMAWIQLDESNKYQVGQKLPRQLITNTRFTTGFNVEYLPIEAVDAN